MDLHVKDGRIIRYSFQPKMNTRGKIFKLLSQERRTKDFFAFSFKLGLKEDQIDGCKLYDEQKEFGRQGAFENKLWRLSNVNEKFEFCDTYPKIFCVPSSMDDSEIKLATGFRSKGRLPVLTWMDKKLGVSLTRSSQPLIGLNLMNKKNKEDHDLINSILKTNQNKKNLIIIDLRPRANAEANRLAKGAGYEKNYENCELKFMNIHNIHVMRASFLKVIDLIQTGGYDTQWNIKLEQTQWLEHTKTILTTSAYFVDVFEQQISILTHCSDGWDRTAQICCLVQIMMDPYYRTIEGFAVLLEKDWLSFGHKFEERLCHSIKNFNYDDSGPIFIQFIECLYQIMYHNPTAFEYNEELLIFLIDESYNCRFGTFLCNSVKERIQEKVYEKTISIWSYVLNSKLRFLNPFYDKNITQHIYPDLRTSSINLFYGYWLRYSFNDKKKFFSNREIILAKRGYILFKESLSHSHVEEALYQKTIGTFQSECKNLQEEIFKLKQEKEKLEKQYETDTNSLLSTLEKQKKELENLKQKILDN